MANIVRPSIIYNIEAEVACLIAEKKKISNMDGLRLFVNSETHKMLLNDDMKLWHFAPLAILDIWENEVITGDPRNSFYLRGDEID